MVTVLVWRRGQAVTLRRRVRSPSVTPSRWPVMRLASQPHCPWGERGSIPLRVALGECRTRSTSVRSQTPPLRWRRAHHGGKDLFSDSRRRASGAQSHGDRPGLQNPERRFDSFAPCGVVAQKESSRPAPGRCECNSRRLHPHQHAPGAGCAGGAQRKRREKGWQPKARGT